MIMLPVPEQAAALPPVPPSPSDRWSWFTAFWLGWAVAGAVVEAIALAQDKAEVDRVKRTLSSNTRTLFGWDSISGRPIEVRWGRLRRTAFVCLAAWFPEHVRQLGRTHNLEV
jgi:hypothetical protein